MLMLSMGGAKLVKYRSNLDILYIGLTRRLVLNEMKPNVYHMILLK